MSILNRANLPDSTEERYEMKSSSEPVKSITCPRCGWTITRSGWKGSMDRQLEAHQKGKLCQRMAEMKESVREVVEA